MVCGVFAYFADEPRYLFIGMIDDKCWSAVVTCRDDTVRIISVRRSRKNEVELYENTVREFDKAFDDGNVDILKYVDMSTIHRPNLEKNQETKRINVDFPALNANKPDG